MIYIPLGTTCSIAYNLKKYNLRKATYPFDWIRINNLNKLQLKKWYLNLDLYIQASKGEGLSISILQSMALGIPVLGSNVSGIKNILNEKKNIGMLFENNKTSLANKIQYFFLMKHKQRDNISKKQNLLVKEKFSEIVMVNRYNELYRMIINK